MDFINWNPFAPAFEQAKPKLEVKENENLIKNAQGYSIEDLETLLHQGNYDNTLFSDIDFSQLFSNKKQRISYYRCMSNFPEINDALDWVSDDSIVPDDEGISAKLSIKNPDDIPKNVKERIYGIFQYLRDDVYKFNKTGWKLFNDWLIDSELYIEQVMNAKKTNIIGIKKLPPFSITPIYERGIIKGYYQNITEGISYNKFNAANTENFETTFASNQIAYANYGKYGKNLYDVRGYLEPVIRPYNQYKSLQDSLIVYRLVNAPEKLVWNIDVGRMPKGKAEAYIKQQIQQYKRKDVYDPDTGRVNSAQNIKSLNQSYWFGRQEDGKGTTVETVGGEMNIGSLDDVKIFQKTLFQVLKLPKSRWEESTMYSSGKSGEVEREEVKFANFTNRLKNQFQPILIDPLITLLKLRGIDEKYLDKDLYDIDFTESNLFADYKEIELTESRFALLNTAQPYVATPETIENGEAIFAKEFAVKHYFKMSDEDYIENQKLLEKQIKENDAKIAASVESEEDVSDTIDTDTSDEASAEDIEKEVGEIDGGEEEETKGTKTAPKAKGGSPLAKAQQTSKELEESRKYVMNEGFGNYINNYKV